MASVSLLGQFRALAESSGQKGVTLAPPEPPNGFLSRVAPVAQLLRDTGTVVERNKRSRGSSAWDEGGTALEELRQVEGVVGDAVACLSLLRRGLGSERVASEQQRAHYESLLRTLERRREALNVAVFEAKTKCLAELAAKNSVARARLIELREENVARPSGPLYDEGEERAAKEAVGRYVFSAEEMQEMERENEELQMRMMDSVVEAAADIQKQLSQLSVLMTQFSLEISVQHEGTLICPDWELLFYFSYLRSFA